MKAKVWKCAKEFKGQVNLTNFELADEELCELEDGEFLAEALFISVDPYVRTFQLRFPVGATMIGRQVAK